MPPVSAVANAELGVKTSQRLHRHVDVAYFKGDVPWRWSTYLCETRCQRTGPDYRYSPNFIGRPQLLINGYQC